MFKKFLRHIAATMESEVLFDPQSLNDPVALRTKWTPNRGGGTNFRTHKCVTTGLNRIEFTATTFNRIFCLLFFLAGLAVIIGYIYQTYPLELTVESILPLAVGAIFSGAGATLYYFATKPVVFDKSNGYFWKGHSSPHKMYTTQESSSLIPIAQIHAVQILSELCTSSGKNTKHYYSYELNIVAHDGRRITVIDHGHLQKIREDAATIAEFLEVPLWDAT